VVNGLGPVLRPRTFSVKDTARNTRVEMTHLVDAVGLGGLNFARDFFLLLRFFAVYIGMSGLAGVSSEPTLAY